MCPCRASRQIHEHLLNSVDQSVIIQEKMNGDDVTKQFERHACQHSKKNDAGRLDTRVFRQHFSETVGVLQTPFSLHA
jgi:hypothetical protein